MNEALVAGGLCQHGNRQLTFQKWEIQFLYAYKIQGMTKSVAILYTANSRAREKIAGFYFYIKKFLLCTKE
jgi:hypothetical protein